MPRKTTLTSGIRVVTEFMPDVHSALVGFWVENGSRHEAGPLNGISQFLEHMLFKGTSRRTALDIAEIEKERRVILQEISMVEDTPEDHVHDLFSEKIWHRHPLGLPVLGKTSTVEAITKSDLRQLLNQCYLGQNVIVSAAGNLDHDLFCRRIEQAFCSLSAGQVRNLCDLPLSQPGTYLLEKPLGQIHLCLGCKALPQTHEGRFSLQVLNTILGASMSSRLFQKIREERGLAYSICSYLSCHSDAGTLVVYCGMSGADLPQVFRLLMEEFRSLKNGQIEIDEVEMAREQIKGNLLLSLKGSDSRMSRKARNEIYFTDQPELKSLIDSLDQVDVASVARVAQNILVADSMTVQIVGNVRDFSISLEDLSL